MKIITLLLVYLWAYSAQACFFDLPSDKVHVCKGMNMQLKLPFPVGGLACCKDFGSMRWSSESDSSGTEYQCWCPSQKQPSTVAVTKSGKRRDGEQTAIVTTTSPIANKSPQKTKPPAGRPARVDHAGLSKFREEALRTHNFLRARHGSPPLKLSDDLNEYAQNYAEHLARVNQGMHHSKCRLPNGDRVGENIAWQGYGNDWPTGAGPVEMWYSEIDDYDPTMPLRWNPPTGHFTQVVWKSTTELGMGKAKTADGQGIFVVGSYRIPGNMHTKKGYYRNVRPKL